MRRHPKMPKVHKMRKSVIRVVSRLPLLAAVLVLPLLLAACDTVKKQVGVGRHSPDEFAVVKRAPLSLPPEYALRPPSADYIPPASEATQQARSVLMGGEASAGAATKAGSAEEAFLARAGAQQADPDIRAAINRDNGYIALQNRTVADKLIFWGDGETNPERVPTSVVDAKAEAERLQKNREEGKSVTEGDVPVIEKKKSTFDKIF
jgi:predicted small secreted protein